MSQLLLLGDEALAQGALDDGLSGCHRYIAPLLRKKGIPASFFLNNRFIDNKSLFYRYKASLLVHQVKKDCRSRERVAEFQIPCGTCQKPHEPDSAVFPHDCPFRDGFCRANPTGHPR